MTWHHLVNLVTSHDRLHFIGLSVFYRPAFFSISSLCCKQIIFFNFCNFTWGVDLPPPKTKMGLKWTGRFFPQKIGWRFVPKIRVRFVPNMMGLWILLFWTLGLPEGVLSNRPSCPSLNTSEIAHFSGTLHEVGVNEVRKVTWPEFLKKYWS